MTRCRSHELRPRSTANRAINSPVRDPPRRAGGSGPLHGTAEGHAASRLELVSLTRSDWATPLPSGPDQSTVPSEPARPGTEHTDGARSQRDPSLRRAFAATLETAVPPTHTGTPRYEIRAARVTGPAHFSEAAPAAAVVWPGKAGWEGAAMPGTEYCGRSAARFRPEYWACSAAGNWLPLPSAPGNTHSVTQSDGAATDTGRCTGGG